MVTWLFCCFELAHHKKCLMLLMDDLGEGEAGPSAPKYRKKAQEAAPYKTKFNPGVTFHWSSYW